jgi:AcrR family transcriptional regulator
MNEVRRKTGYHHGDLRQQLVAATRALVEEKGPDLFSVSEAARAAGVSTAAPYRHFGDRTEMLVAVALEGMAEMTAAFEAAAEGKMPGSDEAISAIGEAYVRYAEAHPGVFRMMFAGDHKTEALEEAGHSCYAVVLGQIACRLGKTDVDDEVKRAGFPLWTFVHGLAFLLIDGKTDFAEMDGEIETLVALATRQLLAPQG